MNLLGYTILVIVEERTSAKEATQLRRIPCAPTSTRCGATMLQALIMCSRGLVLFLTIRSMASPSRNRCRALRLSMVDLASPKNTQATLMTFGTVLLVLFYWANLTQGFYLSLLGISMCCVWYLAWLRSSLLSQ